MDDLSGLRFPPSAESIYRESRARGFTMVSEPLTGLLLRTLAASKPRGRFLELGGGTGAATSWILDGMDAASSLVTVESDPELLAVARRHLGPDPRVTFVRDDAAVFLRNSRGRKFDFIFADTWAGKFHDLEFALAMLARGGLYVVDDMNPQPTWPSGHDRKVADLLERLERDPALFITKLSWASGMVVSARVTAEPDAT
jgi:predicted O-methyltransferase YrrM